MRINPFLQARYFGISPCCCDPGDEWALDLLNFAPCPVFYGSFGRCAEPSDIHGHPGRSQTRYHKFAIYKAAWRHKHQGPGGHKSLRTLLYEDGGQNSPIPEFRSREEKRRCFLFFVRVCPAHMEGQTPGGACNRRMTALFGYYGRWIWALLP